MCAGEEVHVPRLAPTQSVGLPQEFPEYRQERNAADDEWRRAAVRQGQAVTVLEVRHHSRGDGLLTRTKVHFTADQAALPEIGDGELEGTSPEHLAVEVGLHGVTTA